jgi:peptidoglycan/LPS O-acetylase OafA/YrhL
LRQIQRAQWFLIGWLVITIALEWYPNMRLRSIFLTDYAPFFIAGATCFLIYQHGWSLARCAITLVTFATSVRASLASLPALSKTYQVEYSAVVVASLLAIMFAVMLLIASKKTGVIARRNWVAVGALTYPLYLLHQNVGYIMLTASHGRVDPYIALIGIVAFMLIAAWMVHRFVERPFSKPLRMFTEKLLTVVGFNRLPHKL